MLKNDKNHQSKTSISIPYMYDYVCVSVCMKRNSYFWLVIDVRSYKSTEKKQENELFNKEYIDCQATKRSNYVIFFRYSEFEDWFVWLL